MRDPRAILDDVRAATHDRHGVEFLRALVRQIAVALALRCVLITRVLADPRRVRTAAIWLDDAIIKNFAYDLDGAPCERVFRDGECACPAAAPRQFPRDRDLAGLQLESYLGVLLRDPAGRALGHLAVLDGQPMDPARQSLVRAVLDLSAVQAAAELLRCTGAGGSTSAP